MINEKFKIKKYHRSNKRGVNSGGSKLYLPKFFKRYKNYTTRRYIYRNKWNNYPNLWDKYVKIMKEHNCEDIFIDIFSKIEFIFGRGQAVSECLFVLDKENYIECN